MDLSKAILAKSDRLNAVDLNGEVVVTIVGTRETEDPEKPVDIILNEYGPERPLKPARTVLRDIVNAWNAGEPIDNIDTRIWVGRRMRLYVEPEVTWAGKPDPGIRISGLSNISLPMRIKVSLGGRRSKPGVIEPLPDATPVVTENLVADCISALETARSISDLQGVWESAAKAGATSNPNVIAAKDKRKKELS